MSEKTQTPQVSKTWTGETQIGLVSLSQIVEAQRADILDEAEAQTAARMLLKQAGLWKQEGPNS